MAASSRNNRVEPHAATFEGSNIAHMGSAMDKACREAAAAHEPQWTNAGKTPGLQIWRIEQFIVKPWPEEHYGQFHTGDSYIVLHTYHRHPRTTALAWDIYFWLGTETTQDEMGTAAVCCF
ncbi:MAG: hypothetical protein Q8P67_04575 [archaeon]|nr:hypothetical protein [archaeon]